VVDIFDEVDEDLRAERVQNLFRRYGGLIVAAAVLVVVAAGAWQAWRWWDARRDADAASAYLAAMWTADGLRPGDDKSRAAAAGKAFAAVVPHAPPGYATLARLRAAALLADAGDLPAATVIWDEVAGDGAADRLLRDLASLNWVQHQLDHGDPAALRARLGPLTAPDNAWRALALETEGLLDMRTGQTAAAREIFQRLARDATAPDGVRGRASGLLSRLGG
jgi:hypothetical protein